MSRKTLVASLALVVVGLGAFAAVARASAARAAEAARAAQAAQAQAQAAHPQPNAAATWLITFDVGPKWDATKQAQEQSGFPDHMATVQKLTADGTLLVGGPLLDDFTSHKLTGAIWIVKAESADAAKKLVSNDGFVTGEQLKLASVRAFFAAGGTWIAAGRDASAKSAGGAGH